MKLKYLVAKLVTRLQPTALLNCKIDKTSKVGYKSNFINVSVGRYTYFGNNNSIHNVEIGAFCSVASFCAIGGGDHPTEYLSTSPVFYSGKNIFKKHFANYDFKNDKKTIIGNDVWIGENVFVKSGVIIGDGAIIGAHSVVTKNIPPYSIAAGCPCKVIKYRFDDTLINELINLKWWDCDDFKLKKAGERSHNIREFIDNLKKEI